MSDRIRFVARSQYSALPCIQHPYRNRLFGAFFFLILAFITIVPHGAWALPTQVDNSTQSAFPPIGDKGALQSSSAWAVGYYVATYLDAKDEGADATTGDPNVLCSPSFLYNTGYRGGTPSDEVAWAIQRFNGTGCCSLAEMPYTPGDTVVWPSTSAWLDAFKRRPQSYTELGNYYSPPMTTTDLATLKQQLADGNLAITSAFAPPKFTEFYPNDAPGVSNGVLFGTGGFGSMDRQTYVVVGYDDTKEYYDGTTTRTGAMLLANCLGDTWGVTNSAGTSKGFFWVSYDFFLSGYNHFGWAGYFTDKPAYRPRLYLLGGLNAASRGSVLFTGGVGFRSDAGTGGDNSIAWQSSAGLDAQGGAYPISDTVKIPVDLTDGIGSIANPNAVQLYAYFATSGSITSAEFYHDFDGDGTFQSVASPEAPKNCTAGYYVICNVQFTADELTVSPSTRYDIAGPAGGPFTPASRDYTLTNSNDFAVSVTVSKTADWLELSSTSLTLDIDATANVAASVNAQVAAALAPGTYSDTIVFYDSTTGLPQKRAVQLVVRPAVEIAWSSIASPQYVGKPIAVTLRAVDSIGQSVPQINGEVTLAPTFSASVGDGALTWDMPLFNYYEDARTQFILRASEIGGAGEIASLSLDVYRVPPIVLNNFTIRMKHTPLADYSSGASWEGSGWTQVYRSNLSLTQTGWTPFNLSVPFSYNGTDNLMIDISFDNTTWSNTTGLVRATDMGSVRSVCGYSDSYEGDPLSWSGTSVWFETSTQIPDVMIGFAGEANLTPASVVLTNGEWSGNLSFDNVTAGVSIAAEHTSSGLRGVSERFAVDDTVDVSPRGVWGASGPAGGPFAPQSMQYELTNNDASPVTVAVGATAAWIDCSPSSVTIAPGETTTVTASINADANALVADNYLEDVTFTNQSNGLQQLRSASLTVRPAVALAWNPIASPQTGGEPLAVTLRAVDTLGQTVRQIGGSATLALDYTATTGDGEVTFGPPINVNAQAMRFQMIYGASQIETSGTMTSLALNVDELPQTTLRNFTIRIRPTLLSEYSNDPRWETTGWTVVYQADTNFAQSGWVTLNFTTPYLYDGTDNLMVDFSFYNLTAKTNKGGVAGTYMGTRCVMSGQSDNGYYGDPLTWSGTTARLYTYYTLANLRFGFERNVALTTASTGSFANGEWSGNVVIEGSCPNLALRADHTSGLSGVSNRFDLQETSTLTQAVSSDSGTLAFDFGLDRVTTVTFANALPGGTLSVTRIAPLSNPPGFFRYPERLINEWLQISGSALGPNFTADIEWEIDPTSDERMGALAIDAVYRMNGNTLEEQFTPEVSGTRLTIRNVTGFSEWYAGSILASDSTDPTVVSVAVQSALTVDVTFSEPMGAGATTAANYTLSGSGKGTLAANPSSVALVSGSTYRLSWSSGEMLDGGDITLSAASMYDPAGNALGSPSFATHAGGAVGIAPGVASIMPIDGQTIDVVYTEPMASNALAPANYVLSGAGQGTVAANPASVTYQGGAAYRLAWTAGSMVNGAEVTVTVSNVSDLAGNAIGASNSAGSQALPVALSGLQIE